MVFELSLERGGGWCSMEEEQESGGMGMGWDWGLPQTGAWACRVCECTAPYTAACGRGCGVCVCVRLVCGLVEGGRE